MRRTLLFSVIFCLLTSGLSTASARDGKIRGTVVDAETHEPLFGVNVTIDSTSLGASTDKNGKYIILNVPEGTHTLHFQYMGYSKLTIKNIAVVSGITTFRDAELQQLTLEGQEVVIVAERPLIEKGETNEVHRRSAEDLEVQELDAFKVAPSRTRSARPRSGGLKAGCTDDNQQFNRYIHFLEKYGQDISFYPLNISERIRIRLADGTGQGVPNAAIEIRHKKDLMCQGRTLSDGSFLFFPSMHDADADQYDLNVRYEGKSYNYKIKRHDRRDQVFTLQIQQAELQTVPVDIQFILDTTGSMGEEIDRLKKTIEIINLNLQSMSVALRLRYGMVLYRDRGDEYVTENTAFTEDLDIFLQQLNAVSVGGGGDTPEYLEKALDEGLKRFDWNDDGLRLTFIITDAPPHLYKYQGFKYTDYMRKAKERGIKAFAIGTGGLDLQGELILRQIAQFTSAKYLFLTYGEDGDSEGGAPGSVSHHIGNNYQTDKLEAVVLKIVKDEILAFSGNRIDIPDDYFEARKIEDEESDASLNKLFAMALEQLVDFSSLKIDDATPACVFPIQSEDDRNKATGEYFTQQMLLAAGGNKSLRLVERVDFQKILDELNLSMTGLLEESNVDKVGKLIGADLMVTSSLFRKAHQYELFMKLFSVETGEILSVTKLYIDTKLGL